MLQMQSYFLCYGVTFLTTLSHLIAALPETGTLYFEDKVENVFYVGQTVAIAGNAGPSFNGS
jgi:hypothetical protein